MKTSYRSNDTDIYISVKLIDGRSGFDVVQSDPEIVDRYTSVLQQSRIKSLELVSDILNPILMCSIIYEDNQFERLINSHGNIDYHCKLEIRLTSSKLENVVAPEDDVTFSHDFYVNSVEVMSRADEIVTYKIDMISSLFFPFMENRPVSTIGDKSSTQNPVDILGRVFSDPLVLNRETDKSSSTDITYISAANETVLETLGNVLANNMIGPESDLLLIPFDHMENRHDVWFKSSFEEDAINKENTNIDKFRKVVTLNIESIQGYDPFGNNIGQITTKNYVSNQEIMESTKDTVVYDFNFDTRMFNSKPHKRKLIEDSFGAKVTTTGYSNRIKTDMNWFTTTPYLLRESSHWNDKSGVYFFKRAVTCLTKNGNVLVNTIGNIYRKPGIDMFLLVDSTSKDFSSLLNLQGRWLLTKVRHVFKPQDETYTNNLLLSRLDIPDEASEFREAT